MNNSNTNVMRMSGMSNTPATAGSEQTLISSDPSQLHTRTVQNKDALVEPTI